MPTFNNNPVVSRNSATNLPFTGGVLGESSRFSGVRGVTTAPYHGGVTGVSDNDSAEAGPGVYGESAATGVWGKSDTWVGVFGESLSTTGGAGVWGENMSSNGVVGITPDGRRLYGRPGPGVVGRSRNSHGVYGETASRDGGVAVWGDHRADGTGVLGRSGGGVGVWGVSERHEGVHAETRSSVTAAIAGFNLNPNSTGAAIYGEHRGNSIGVIGISRGGVGVWGVSRTSEGVHAETNSPGMAAIAAFNLNPAGTGAAVFAQKAGDAGHAGFFDGRVWVSGELAVGGDVVLANGDCAEDFPVAETSPIEPGSVVVVDGDGALRQCEEEYDGRVVGVISGAGSYRPALVLDRKEPSVSRQPVALMGKVFCRVDADLGAIAVGDLLTTSPTRGHAMKASDRPRAFGAVIGKALAARPCGRGLIPMLVAAR